MQKSRAQHGFFYVLIHTIQKNAPEHFCSGAFALLIFIIFVLLFLF